MTVKARINGNRKYTFFNSGSRYQFDPKKMVNHNGQYMSLLEVHRDEVKFRASKDVFILTDTGEVLAV